MTTDNGYVRQMVSAYLECALWTEEEEAGDGELSPGAIASAEEDCANFLDYLDEAEIDYQTLDRVQMGHDFWLTRNHHGAGFWDRGLGELGEKLTTAAHTFGDAELYAGDDGLLHFT